MSQQSAAVLQFLSGHEEQILTEWLQEAGANSTRISDATRRAMRGEGEEILRGLREALQGGADPEAFQGEPWKGVRNLLESLSRSRAAQGQSAGDTSIFMLALK